MSLTYRKLIKLDEQLEKIDQFAEEAQGRIDYESAHDEQILAGIKVVEDFLRATGRVCYGGTAMNIHLPKKYKFYDPNTSIPDYDFLTPNGEQDVKNLEQRLRNAGFADIGSRPGVHEGTTKLYLNFIPIADITEIDVKLYNLFKKHSDDNNGISYMDVNSLRMMMYLELSRPRGEVSRWHKVFERLKLLEHADIPRNCKAPTIKKTRIPLPIYRILFYYALNNNRVMAGASVLNIYKQSLKTQVTGDWLFSANLPLVIYSPNISSDLSDIKQLMGQYTVKVTEIEAIGDFIPRSVVLENDGKPILLMVEETACHAYNSLQMRSGKAVRIASLDTISTLYLSLMLTNRPLIRRVFPQSILCMAQTAMEISSYMRRRGKGQFPFISLDCTGHQVGLPTLLRERFKRIRGQHKTSKESTSYKRTKTRRK